MTKEERLQRQMQRLAEMQQPERDLHKRGYRYIAGIDEAGRGPLAGPVAAAAVVLPEDFDVPGVDDSKKLSEKRREELYGVIMERAQAVGVGIVDHETIDRINILQAAKLAMSRALDEAGEDLKRRCGSGGEDPAIDYILLDAVELPDRGVPQEAIIKGDAKVLAIAAASIIAKVTRDRIMAAYAEEYPGYGFEKNKGYGTKAHYDGLRQQGTCPIHRKTFLKNFHG